jgi:hypothetical protein
MAKRPTTPRAAKQAIVRTALSALVGARPNDRLSPANIRTAQQPGQDFLVIIHPASSDGLIAPLLPRKNVDKERADTNDGDHQDCSTQNNVNHDNASLVVLARAQVDAENPGFWRQSAVRLRQR